MLFNSFGFAGFFVVVYGLYLLTMRRSARAGESASASSGREGRRLSVQNALLLVASYVFYACWDWRFLGLIWISTLVDYVCGLALDRRRAPVGRATVEHDEARPHALAARARKSILLASIGVNLGILGFFKYFDFFAESAAALLETVGLPTQPRLLHVILPVGISFYTFQTLSYTIDVYRGRMRAHRNLLDFALFVAFFPQLVAGPIVRARDFLPQVSRPRRLRLEQVYEGAYLIFWGLFKKVVIADNLALLVDRVFSADPTPLGGTVLVAVYAFAIQIYCDFSGYTDIARGCAKMMGFDLRLNFNLPYLASNPAEFWRRWHISLSTWLRDYLYIPLGGNRKGPRRTSINLMLTMVLGGLWHGAAWPFVLWGVYQGALLIAHRAMMPWMDRFARGWGERTRRAARWLAVAAFFHLICLGWLIFRAESVGQVVAMLSALASGWPLWILSGANTVGGTGLWVLLGFAAPLVAVQMLQHHKNDLQAILRLPIPVRALAYTVMFYGLVLYDPGSDKPFIYFQF